MHQALVILINVPDMATATTIAHQLVRQRLAACVNILPGVQSIYQWQEKIEQASEVTLMAKTMQSRYVELEAAVRAVHPYDVPEIIALPITNGLPQYLDWIEKETKKDVDI